jgi:hypothetical protein
VNCAEDINRLNTLLRDDGYLYIATVGSSTTVVPMLLDIAGERESVVLTFAGVEEFSLVGGLSKGAIDHPELVGDGLNVFSTGVLAMGEGEVRLVLSWEGERPIVLRAHSVQIEFER